LYTDSDLYVTPKLFDYLIKESLEIPYPIKNLLEENSGIDDQILQITPYQSQFISWIVKLVNLMKTLDIGTYKGCSALSVALSSAKNCKTISIDNDLSVINKAKTYWEKFGVFDKIESIHGNATDVLQKMLDENNAESFDFIFIDADKANYVDYYEFSLRLLKKGGIIFIDNTLYFGTVVGKRKFSADIKRWVFKKGVTAIKKLNKIIKNDPRVDSCLIPIADGRVYDKIPLSSIFIVSD